MPKAFGQKFHYLDHDTDVVNAAPPVQNQWYTAFDAHDVRLLECVIYQTNTNLAAKDIEIRWTIDGNVYLGSVNAADNTLYYVYRNHWPSAGPPNALSIVVFLYNACYFVDKRGINFKVEVRLTSVPGVNQVLNCWCVRETLELT